MKKIQGTIKLANQLLICPIMIKRYESLIKDPKHNNIGHQRKNRTYALSLILERRFFEHCLSYPPISTTHQLTNGWETFVCI
jgi:hypothetical protein